MDHQQKYGLIKIGVLMIISTVLVLILIYKARKYGQLANERAIAQLQLENHTFINTSTEVIHLNLMKTASNKLVDNENEYFVKSELCKIPRIEPYSAEVMKIFKPAKYENCSKDEPIITALYNESLKHFVLHINENFGQKSDNKNVEDILCCFREIKRQISDDEITISDCTPITQHYAVAKSTNSILTECQYKVNDTQKVQSDGFSFIQSRQQNSTNSTTNERKPNRKPNVFLIGIDSLSRMNFRRNMPKTFEFLTNNSWYEMEGYNKIGDSSFPNLMAVLTGYNESLIQNLCKPKTIGGLDHCFFLWNRYKNNDYVTAYAEDETKISTFNYDMMGFKNPPTDFYLRPFMLAAEQNLMKEERWYMNYCFFRRHAAQYVFDFCNDFYQRYKDRPKFGLFWSNSFSHSFFNSASAFDHLMLDYFKQFEANGMFNDSIVIFFSNNGIRWGPLLELKEGYYEQRLPFLYIWLPIWFRKSFPDLALALEINRHLLTSPYDLHMTLKHILELFNDDYKVKPSFGCHACQTLFRPIPALRNCADAGIPEQWCTCDVYERLVDPGKAQKITQLVIEKMNFYLVSKNLSAICKPIIFDRVLLAENSRDAPSTWFRIKFKTDPNSCTYETNVKYNARIKKVEVKLSHITKLNSQEENADCVNVMTAKKFCNCR